MKLTPAEYKLLGALNSVAGGRFPVSMLKPSTKACASKMRMRGLISKRAWDKGDAVATVLGKRSYSYGKR